MESIISAVDKLEGKQIAYFCSEFALRDTLPIFSGGLGVLAGDALKESSDLELPLVGIGLFYKNGYFKQQIIDGQQHELPAFADIEGMGVEKVLDEDGLPKLIDIRLGERNVFLQIWKVPVGNVTLYLLDSDIPHNEGLDARLTLSLYPSDQQWKIQQEIILGIGGVRALWALGLEPNIYHMNEGHSAFAVFEIAHQYMKRMNIDFAQALAIARKKIVFTNHTLVPSGNDLFPRDLVSGLLSEYATHLKLPIEELLAHGNYVEDGNLFSMANLALAVAVKSSAVSMSHAVFAKSAWPKYELIPITNGVYENGWKSEILKDVLEPRELWSKHLILKKYFRNLVYERIGMVIPEDTLVIAWARRFAAYKQPGLILEELGQLKRILTNEEKPVYLVIGGKAHPGDELGKQEIRRINQLIVDAGLLKHVGFLPNYNLDKAKILTKGADVWLNTPMRGKEACGTSGMKASMNGVLSCALSDGWTDEVYLSEIGFALDPLNPAKSFYDILENKIVPMYYDNRVNGIPEEWIRKMLATIQTASHYTTRRMMLDYITKLYLPLIEQN